MESSPILLGALLDYGAEFLIDFLGVDPRTRELCVLCDGGILCSDWESPSNSLTTCNRNGRWIEPTNATWNLYISGVYRG